MDWTLAIERNRAALKRVLAALVAMAGLGQSAIGSRQSEQAAPDDHDCQPPADSRPTLPRHLHRAILRLLRPTESAMRRLIILMARGLVVTLAPPRPRKASPRPTILRNGVGTGILMPPGSISATLPRARPPPRTIALPLLDPLAPFRPKPKRPAANGIARISVPGITRPRPVAPRRPPAPDDVLDATRLALRLQALGAALGDLPRQARRFARWRLRKETSRDAAGAQDKTGYAADAQNKKRRVWPLRPGRPPGQPRPNRRTHAVHEILNDLHGLAFDVLEHPDTS